jgi:hypothetical protein
MTEVLHALVPDVRAWQPESRWCECVPLVTHTQENHMSVRTSVFPICDDGCGESMRAPDSQMHACAQFVYIIQNSTMRQHLRAGLQPPEQHAFHALRALSHSYGAKLLEWVDR